MSDKPKLVGQYVSVYLDGGWELSGEIKIVKDDRIFIESKDNSFMIFRNKISAIWMNARKSKSAIREHASAETDSAQYEKNKLDYGMSLPFDMLTEEAQLDHDDYSNMSIAFGAEPAAEEGAPSGMTFSIKGDDFDGEEK